MYCSFEVMQCWEAASILTRYVDVAPVLKIALAAADADCRLEHGELDRFHIPAKDTVLE